MVVALGGGPEALLCIAALRGMKKVDGANLVQKYNSHFLNQFTSQSSGKDMFNTEANKVVKLTPEIYAMMESTRATASTSQKRMYHLDRVLNSEVIKISTAIRNAFQVLYMQSVI
jgi:hypothetical protein